MLIKKSYPFLLGTWILRTTNDKKISSGISYLIINSDETVKFRTLKQEGIFATKKSISGIIYNVTNTDYLEYDINLKYYHFNKYSYSIFGVEIPEYKSQTKNYMSNKIYNIKLHDKSILVSELNSTLYYLFDLQIGKIKNPFVETGLNTLFFTQIISFFLNLVMANIIHYFFLIEQ